MDGGRGLGFPDGYIVEVPEKPDVEDEGTDGLGMLGFICAC